MADVTHEELTAGAMRAEVETLSRECRLAAGRLDRFLAPDFHEIGASGVEITREGTACRVAEYTARSGDELVPRDMCAEVIAPDVVMVKYRLSGPGRSTLRTSLWRLTPGGQWQMFHHQGTPTSS